MNILVLSNHFPPQSVGGYEVACETYIRQFKRDTVTVLTTHYGFAGPTIEGDVVRVLPNVYGTWPQGETHLPRAWRRFFTPEVLGTTRHWIKRIRPDLCYVWNLRGLSLAPVMAARLAALPVVYHLEDNWLPDVAFHPLQPIETTKRILGAPFTFHGKTGAIFVSHHLLESYKSQQFAFRRHVVIYNGVPTTRSAESARIHDRVSHSPIRLLFVGRIVPEKGLQVLLDALRIAQHQAPGTLALTVVGDGPPAHVNELRQSAIQGSLQVDWWGRLSRAEVEDAYAHHDVAVVPSTWEEPFGLVAIEAMAAGLPVVATRSGGLAEIVRPGLNGMLVPKNDATALADALLAFVAQPDLTHQIGARAAVDARTRFDAVLLANEARTFLGDVVDG